MFNKRLEQKIDDAFSNYSSLTKLYSSLQDTQSHYRTKGSRIFKEAHTAKGEEISLQFTKKERVLEIKKDDDNYFRITKNINGLTTYEAGGNHYSNDSDKFIKSTLTNS